MTSGVQILDRGLVHTPILWSRICLLDGLITTMTSSVMALTPIDVIWTFCTMKLTPRVQIWVLTFVPNLVLSPRVCLSDVLLLTTSEFVKVPIMGISNMGALKAHKTGHYGRKISP